ncbi:NAD(P)H-binding protein [Mycobacterium sp. WUMAC-067]|uniref:SDR family oxidoreductase n=1 Tax=unclassified Mycobacterium TaxID=2642494 RepID=UPI001CD98EE7|nr:MULTISPECIES: NmrA family protein [unclassified Mycobacterium]MCA2240969.1 NAD(P)H-binding protein [Mycobacterium sp. WUMAC-067]MCA2313059.1 NAD(P)H-binding protein [Mycobacterium sp. WUMAC-025]
MRAVSTIAVIGATGTAGSRVVARLRSRDVAVVEISREQGIDLFSGPDLCEALKGVDVAIDVSDPVPPEPVDVSQALATASHNIVGACATQDVQRLVVPTIAGIDHPEFDGIPYYEGKRAAKNILLDGPVPTTIVKSTQWYECATHCDAVSCDGDEVIVEDWLIQPIAADTVADVLVEAALGQSHTPRTITGPHPIRLPELTSKLLAQQGDSRQVRAVRPAVAALANGVLLASGHAVVVGPDVDTWLQTLAPPSIDGHQVADGEEPSGS